MDTSSIVFMGIAAPEPQQSLHLLTVDSPFLSPCLPPQFQRVPRAQRPCEADCLVPSVIKLLWLVEWSRGGDRR